MISRKFIASVSINFKILCSTVTMNPSFLAVLGQSCHNNINTVVLSMNSFCIGCGIQMVDKTKMTEEDKIKLQKLIERWKSFGMEVPETISDEQYFQLFKEKTLSAKKRYLNYLVKGQNSLMKRKLSYLLKLTMKEEQQKERMSLPQDHLKYGLFKNTMFAQISKNHLFNLYHHRLASAMIHGQPLVIDLGFEDHMIERELNSYSRILKLAIYVNSNNAEPFNLTFCNANFESKGYKKLVNKMPDVIQPTFPINITSQSYHDMFPEKKIVYLSPDAEEELIEFDHNSIYIIGGIVDLREQTPLTLSKAKKENIKVQKLPLDRYHIPLKQKCLPAHVIVAILLDLRTYGNWKKAFYNIPKENRKRN